MIPNTLNAYTEQYTSPENEVLKALYRETQLKVLMPHMCSGHVQGMFLKTVTQIAQAKHVLEIGTFTGYATLCFAMGMEEDGNIDTIDCNAELEDLCVRYFEMADQKHKIKMHIGKALDIIPTLHTLYDIVFIDADKASYEAYFEAVIDKTRRGGLIIADNVLWKGQVCEEKRSKDAEAMHRYNSKLKEDSRVESVLLTVRDGLHIARKI